MNTCSVIVPRLKRLREAFQALASEEAFTPLEGEVVEYKAENIVWEANEEHPTDVRGVLLVTNYQIVWLSESTGAYALPPVRIRLYLSSLCTLSFLPLSSLLVFLVIVFLIHLGSSALKSGLSSTFLILLFSLSFICIMKRL